MLGDFSTSIIICLFAMRRIAAAAAAVSELLSFLAILARQPRLSIALTTAFLNGRMGLLLLCRLVQ